MPNLLQIAITAGGGSIGSITTQIGDSFVKTFGGNSFITYHFRCYPSPSSKNISIKVGTPLSFLVHILWTRLFDAHGLASWYDTKKLIRVIEEKHIDIVHLHNIHGYYVNIKMLINYLRENNIPVVWTIHDCWNFTGHCAHYYEVNCYRWKKGCAKCPYKKRYPKSILMNRSAHMFNFKKELFTSLDNVVLIPVSNWQEEILRESFLGNKRIIRVYNGIDTDVFRPCDNTDSIKSKYGLKNRFVLLGVATGWGPDKGSLDYIKLSKLLPKDYQIVLVGLNDDAAKQFPSDIMCLPRTNSQNELVELYSVADVLMSLSYQESMGLTIVEAMACGTPAIVYNNTAQPELVNTNTGIVVETGNVDQVYSAVKDIRKKGKQFYSNFCRERAESFFSNTKCYGQYMEVYNLILNSYGRGKRS